MIKDKVFRTTLKQYFCDMNEQKAYTLINQQNGNLAFKLFWFDNNSHFDHLQRNNFYSLIWIKKGSGLLKVDFSEYLFKGNTVFTFSPYQPFLFSTDKNLSGFAIQFHSDFYCIHRNPQETNCDTFLFNNIYQPPFFSIDQPTEDTLTLLCGQLKTEMKNADSGNYELLIPYLKIFLVTASRIKSTKKVEAPKVTNNQTPYILTNLKKTIEENFRLKHSASDYAAVLNISPNALAKLVKEHFNKTLTNLISERMLVEAKRELYMTNKTVKEIAWYLGYTDEFYFSRVFKINAGISPQTYRETVGFGKAEISNLN